MVSRESSDPTVVSVMAVALATATVALVTSNMLATLLLDRVDDDVWDAFQEQVIEDARTVREAFLR